MTINPKNYQSLIREYQLTPGVTYKVTLENGKLMGRRTGRDKQELWPADLNTYFVKVTVRGEKVFIRYASEKVTELRDRRENNDLVWKKIR